MNAGQFLYPSAYGYALPERNEYIAPVNPYFPGLAYAGFAYPVLYYYTELAAGQSDPSSRPPPVPTEGESRDTGSEGAGTALPPRGATRRLPSEPNSVVEAVQGELARRGYYAGDMDGISGPATAEAIRRFQTDVRLRVTGEANQATLFALGLN